MTILGAEPQSRPKKLLDGYLTRDGLAKELGLSVRALINWDRRGHGPAKIKIGGRVYYSRADVQAFIASQHMAARQKAAA